jgi:hypothetical protein
MNRPLPPAEVLESGQLVWPDEPNQLLGVAFCQATAPELRWLNRTIVAFSGTANLGTGTLQVVGRALTPDMLVAGR